MDKKNQKDFVSSRRRFIKHSISGFFGGLVIQNGFQKGLTNHKSSETVDIVPKIKSYRTLGRTGFSVSDIGIGAPWNEGILNAALDAGINYIDTAEAYHQGRSELTIGRAIRNRDRKKLFITTKLGLKGTESKDEILNRTRKCLKRLNTDYLDCLMIWAASSIKIVSYPPFLAAVDQLKREGKLNHAGVACHGAQWRDEAVGMDDILLAAIRSGYYDVVLLVYNFLQKEIGERIIAVGQKNNIGITLMKTNPVGNYFRAMERLSPENNTHESLRGFYREYLPRFKAKADASQEFLKKNNLESPSEIRSAAIKFTLSNPGVHSVLGSMDNFDIMEAFIKISGQSFSSSEERQLSLYEKGINQFYCRLACGICEKNCPHSIPVNTIMRFNYYFEVKKWEKYALMEYKNLNRNNAGKCITCQGYCESACPFNIHIRGLMALAHQNLNINGLV